MARIGLIVDIKEMAEKSDRTSIRIDGRKLAREIALRSKTGADFAKLAHMSPSTLSGVVAHDNPVSARVARRIAKALHDTLVIAELALVAPERGRGVKDENAASRRRGTAYHEAGHYAVLEHFGLPVSSITIEPARDYLGAVEHPTPYMIDMPPTRRERRAVARQMIVTAYAGLEAERLVDPNADPRQSEADDENAFWLSREFGVFPSSVSYVGDDTHLAYLRRLRGDARRLVRRLRPEIDRIAARLDAVAPDEDRAA